MMQRTSHPIAYFCTRTIIAVLALLLVGGETFAMRAMPDDNLDYPVLITLDDRAYGSGFYFRKENKLYFVTARHVLFQEDKKTETLNMLWSKALLTSYFTDPTTHASTQQMVALDLRALDAAKQLRAHPDRDIAIILLAASSQAGPGPLQQWSPGVTAPPGEIKLRSISATNVKLFSDVLVGNEAFVFGYPRSIGLKEMPQVDYNRPLLRKGIVAGKSDLLQTLVLDCPIYYGNSGGPILEAEQVSIDRWEFKLIGVAIEFVPFVEHWKSVEHGYTNVQFENSGYSIATPVDAILELLAS